MVTTISPFRRLRENSQDRTAPARLRDGGPPPRFCLGLHRLLEPYDLGTIGMRNWIEFFARGVLYAYDYGDDASDHGDDASDHGDDASDYRVTTANKDSTIGCPINLGLGSTIHYSHSLCLQGYRTLTCIRLQPFRPRSWLAIDTLSFLSLPNYRAFTCIATPKRHHDPYRPFRISGATLTFTNSGNTEPSNKLLGHRSLPALNEFTNLLAYPATEE
ncbi:uncharacterized protein BDR25DRAFT_397524 [Lindgomyces ingoldianus]|uniref:Uncharacterized protein n=1 Tax=Lindgomyces ingoldianus TaxID=673940 RepID=A0ACB6Q7Z5_9PLEO|nr:uncharacterized protein BDR25DRAFT_397524 [Lindgomyces ingoldianus]KAF2462640.1 hypothetical protein BDR25DRAFT_397524 [Lindgomyces ingoldianus]